MNKINSTHNKNGNMNSYIIGYILSLIFTALPYYLVVNQLIKGSVLLAAILCFAIIQMIIQVTFFLHLGRGPKPNWNLFFFISTVGIILIVTGGSIFIMKNLHYNMLPSDQARKLVEKEGIYQIGGEKTGACKGQFKNHKVYIKNGYASPELTSAKKCDTITFINEDKIFREIAFGEHPNHDVYAGETELLITNTRPKTITLSELGLYNFHDHLNPNTNGSFEVSE